MAKPDVEAFFDATTSTISYVVFDSDTREAAIVDSVLDFDSASGRTSHDSANRLLEFVATERLSVKLILETHVHADHLTAAQYLREATGARIAIGEHITSVQRTFGELFNLDDSFKRDGSQFDLLLADRARLSLGNLTVEAIHTPGHTPNCMVYSIGDAAFVGDTLFMPDFGTARCDFPGGDARVLYQSIQSIYRLPEDTRLFMCHDYKAPGRDVYAWESTVAEERADNIHVCEGTSEEAFIEMRTRRDAGLDVPRLILPAVQVNMNAGNFPAPESNQVSYLKLPIDVL